MNNEGVIMTTENKLDDLKAKASELGDEAKYKAEQAKLRVKKP
jgi:hypothetical protein